MKIFAFAAAVSMCASPCAAASIPAHGAQFAGPGSIAVANMYFRIPLGGSNNGRLQSGLRVQLAQDYRLATARTGPTSWPDPIELRLERRTKATLYVGGIPLTGKSSRALNFSDHRALATAALIAVGIVGGIVVYKALDREGHKRCLLPEGCS